MGRAGLKDQQNQLRNLEAAVRLREEDLLRQASKSTLSPHDLVPGQQASKSTLSPHDLLFPGQQLDALDSVGKWCESEVLEVGPSNRSVHITYTYWGDAWNEWLELSSGRLAPYGSRTYQPGGVLRRGQRIEVLDTVRKWLEAEVIDETPSAAKVHFKNWHAKYDEWLPRDSPRIRPFGRGKKLRKARAPPHTPPRV